jgi:hypothetical protein
MKKLLLITLITLSLSACDLELTSNQKKPETSSEKAEDQNTKAAESASQSKTSTTKDSVNQEPQIITGSSTYYQDEDSLPSGSGNNVLGRVCFEPAQLETFNSGQMICFTNTEEALQIIQAKTAEAACFIQEFVITNFVDRSDNDYKSAPCFKENNCQPDEAELVDLICSDN